MSEESITEEQGKKLKDIKREAEEKACPVQRALYYIEEFLAGPMCGKCYPCALGTQEAKIRLIKIVQHLDGISALDIEALRRIGSQMREGSFCKKGKETGRFIIETITNSEEEFNQHLSGICPKRECINLIEYVVNPELCVMCGKCLEACKYNAIVGEKREPYLSGYLPFEIRQKRCTRCGECVEVCPTGAIEIITTKIEEVVMK
ncbi:MAG: 4Fe-4S binding protein [Thermodesulfovibrionales bacterium]|nr:4Fe-4S binding protein [Thermodesulfovibrionales bacterium]